MRNEHYDLMVNEALTRINELPDEEFTLEVNKIKWALTTVLTEKDENKLKAYYKNIEEFHTVNEGRGLEYMSGEYLLKNGVE